MMRKSLRRFAKSTEILSGAAVGGPESQAARVIAAPSGSPKSNAHMEPLETRALLSGNLTINPTFDSSITALSDHAAIESSIKAAISRLESEVTANAPVTVNYDFKNSATGLGGSQTPQADIDYSTYLADLEANPNKSASDITALSNMPAGPNTGINGATQVLLTAANLAAIGDTTDADSLVSGFGGFNSIISLNFSIINDSRPDADPDKYDLQSVVGHEMDEGLGIGGNATTLYQPGDTAPTSLPTDVSGLDFFRYNAPGVKSFTYNPNTSAYFSIDGGKSNLVYFNQQNGADGADYGDWGNPQGTAEGNTPPQLQDAFGSPGATADLGINELTALDVVGWNLIPQATAPVVTLNPLNKTVSAGSTVTFTAAATGTPTPTVQWQVSTNGGATFTNIAGATSTTLSFAAALNQNGNEYRAVFTNSANKATTTAATLTVTQLTTGASITGNVFKDPNGSGVQDKGEANFANVKVYIDLDHSGVFKAADPYTFTNAQGVYTLSNLKAGQVYINTVSPTGYQQDFPYGKRDHIVTVTSGQVLTAINFAETTGSHVSGLVYTLVNGKKVYLANVKVTIRQADGKGKVLTRYTDSVGYYGVGGLPNTSYIVTITLPTGYVLSSGTLSQTTPVLGSGQDDDTVNFILKTNAAV